MPSEDIQQQFGCLFVRTGRELKTIEMIQHLHPEVEAFAVTQIKHQSRNGVKSIVKTILLPGYVLFRADDDFEARRFYSLENMIRLLKYEDREWVLRGEDHAFAQWIFRTNGLIGMSKAYREGTRVQIIDGPLKDFDGKIIRVDSRNRNAQVSFGFGGQVFTAWLAFEWMEEKDAESLLKNDVID